MISRALICASDVCASSAAVSGVGEKLANGANRLSVIFPQKFFTHDNIFTVTVGSNKRKSLLSCFLFEVRFQNLR